MWVQWINYSNPTRELQEALEYNGETPQTDTQYTQTTDKNTTLKNPLVTPITKQPTKQTPSDNSSPYTPPLFGSLFGSPSIWSPSINSSTKPKEESPYSPFYRLWGHH
jgi:hypothetical protein